MPAYPNITGDSYVSQSILADQEETINLYSEIMESKGASSPRVLYEVPGFELRYRVAQSGGRAMFTIGAGGTSISGRTFGVIGSHLYEFFADDTSSDRGSVADDGNPATICTNGDGGNQLFITSGGNGYNYDLITNTLTQVSGLVATQGGFLYGYFVAFNAVANEIRISDLYDGTVWDPTQFLARSTQADPWNGMLVTPYGQIFLPGSQTGDFLYNNGAFPFPFAPDPSGLIEEGIAATFSVKQAGKSSCWLSTNKNGGYEVQRAAGYTPQRISDHAFEYQVSRYSRVSDAIGETYEDQGHSFFLLTFPTARVTWGYDFTTGKWAKRLLWIAEENRWDASHPTFHCFAFNKHLMADRTSSAIYQMDIAFTSDVDDRPIRWMRRSPAVVAENKRVYLPSFEALPQVGNGTATGQGSDPIMMYRSSNDGGHTFGNERHISTGKIGEYGARAQLLRTGSARKRVVELTGTDPIRWQIIEAYQEIKRSTEGQAA